MNNHKATGNPEILNVPAATSIADYPILGKEVEAALKALSQQEWTTSQESYQRQEERP